jgi:hypothetical protein
MSRDESPFESLLGRAPEPGLESSLLAVRVGAVPLDEVLPSIASWPLIVLSTEDYRLGPNHLRPTILQGSDGVPAVAAFTSPDRIGRFVRDAVHPVRLPGRLLAEGVKPGVGIVVNPESEPSVAISPRLIQVLSHSSIELVARPPGSRELSRLELAIAAGHATTGTRDEILAAVGDSQLSLATSVEPTRGQRPDFASTGEGAELSYLAWTDPSLARHLPARVWWVTVRGGDLPKLLGSARVHINPGTGFSFTFDLAQGEPG